MCTGGAVGAVKGLHRNEFAIDGDEARDSGTVQEGEPFPVFLGDKAGGGDEHVKSGSVDMPIGPISFGQVVSFDTDCPRDIRAACAGEAVECGWNIVVPFIQFVADAVFSNDLCIDYVAHHRASFWGGGDCGSSEQHSQIVGGHVVGPGDYCSNPRAAEEGGVDYDDFIVLALGNTVYQVWDVLVLCSTGRVDGGSSRDSDVGAIVQDMGEEGFDEVGGPSGVSAESVVGQVGEELWARYQAPEVLGGGARDREDVGPSGAFDSIVGVSSRGAEETRGRGGIVVSRGIGLGSGGGDCMYFSRSGTGRSGPRCSMVGSRGDGGPGTSRCCDVVVWAVHIFVRVRWVVGGGAGFVVCDAVTTALGSG